VWSGAHKCVVGGTQVCGRGHTSVWSEGTHKCVVGGDTEGDQCTIHRLEGPPASQCPIKETPFGDTRKGKKVSKQNNPAHTVKSQKKVTVKKMWPQTGLKFRNLYITGGEIQE